VAKEKSADIRVAVQAADIYRVAQAVSIPVYAEHVDPIDPGQNTGFILPEAVMAEGATGTLLNHSEHRLERDVLERSMREAKDAGLKVVICAATPEEGGELSTLYPEFIAVEPPELIGGTMSVSSAQPEIIKKAVEIISVPVLVGAGIHTGEDVKVALELGAKGVLLASGITKAEDPKKALLELLDF
ncbi:triosephosphate isomerase, partial [Candidatus Woesearchaeota archaeon]|nr:triosephosphate isomerase [Candidatus Woesearchaeota archaeon]